MTMSKTSILATLAVGLILVGAGCNGSKSFKPYDAERNPTILANRGAPSLDDEFRPAAWVLIDGKEGSFTEVDGRPQVQWVINEPVGPSPTFRVEAFEPVLGKPTIFKAVLRTVQADDGSDITYAIAATGGDFEVGRDYSLATPGESFVIRERPTMDVVDSIKPLPPGTYMIAASIENPDTTKVGLAITYFTVAGQAE